TVGPQDQCPVKLASCYSSSLNLVKSNHIREVAFPCIATGGYAFDNIKAAHVACETLKNWLDVEENAKSV
ncbi:O-acetyl-ADP-ribose deacetylase macrod2, partial [Globomyces sp. JEL0801]